MQAVRSQEENINGPFINEEMLGLTSRRNSNQKLQ